MQRACYLGFQLLFPNYPPAEYHFHFMRAKVLAGIPASFPCEIENRYLPVPVFNTGTPVLWEFCRRGSLKPMGNFLRVYLLVAMLRQYIHGSQFLKLSNP